MVGAAFWTLVFVSTTLAHQCPDNGWEFNPDNHYCYLLIQRPMPQHLAQKYCSLLSTRAHLARVGDQEQNDFLQEYAFSGERIWLQAKAKFDIIDSRASLLSPGLVLRWKNGNPVSFGKWAKGHGLKQMNSKQLCVLMNRHGEWLNADCGQPENFVCEIKSLAVRKHRGEHPISPKCPLNWTFNPKTSACYKAFSGDSMSWLDADKLCGDEGAKNGEEALLTSVHSPVENQFLLDLAAKESPQFEYIMLGAIGDSNNHKQWDWVDGSSFSSFTNWQPNKPGGPRKAAVLFMLRSKNGKWMNSYADEKYRRGSAVAICKFLVG